MRTLVRTNHLRAVWVAALALLGLLPGAASAQGTTGTVRGRVVDVVAT